MEGKYQTKKTDTDVYDFLQKCRELEGYWRDIESVRETLSPTIRRIVQQRTEFSDNQLNITGGK